METAKITPLSADEIISRVEKRIRWQKLSKNIAIVIRVLSEKALSYKELTERLKDTDYDFRGADSRQIRQRLHAVRRYGILDRQDGWYFIKGTKADPKVQNGVNGANQPLKKRIGKPCSLRSIVYEILQKEPLAVNQLLAKVKDHPAYDDSQKYAKNLLIVIQRTLYSERKRLFERENPQRFSRWRVKADSTPPPKKSYQNAQTKRQALHRLMQSKSVINGWLISDLFEEVIRPDSGYNIKPGSSLDSAMRSLYQMLNSNKGELFEQIVVKGKPKRWRAKWLGPLKIPSGPDDFKDLAGKVLDDLAFSLNLEDLLRNVRQYGHLFGYLANELPLSFLENGIVRALARTEYAKRMQD